MEEAIARLDTQIGKLEADMELIQNNKDYYCSSCYLGHFYDNLLGNAEEEILPSSTCPCMLSSCKYQLTNYELWRLVSRATPEEELYAKRRYVLEKIAKIRGDEGALKLFTVKNIPDIR